MNKSKDIWTQLHDLAMVYLALAYGTDRILSDEELDAIVESLKAWDTSLEHEAIQELVLETMAVFLEGNPRDEVVDCINTLKRTLSRQQRIQALKDVVRIAKADGIVLGSEHDLISVLAQAWEVKTSIQADKMASTTSGRPEQWSLAHDIGLMYVVIAHGGDSKLDDSEIKAMVNRMGQWHPELDEESVRVILRTALSFYASEPGSEALRESISSIKEALPGPQRLAVLDDLIHIASADGHVNDNEKEMISSISKTLDVAIRLAPTA